MSSWIDIEEVEELDFSDIDDSSVIEGLGESLKTLMIEGEAYEIELEKIGTKLLLTADSKILNKFGIFEINSYWLIPELIPFPYRKIQELSNKCGIKIIEGEVELSESTIERERFLELIELEINTI